MSNKKTSLLKKLTQKRKTGDMAEDKALQYLQKKGLKLLKKNYSTKAGEIDLIMQDTASHDTSLIFVEVRYRKNNNFGGAAASVTTSKQQRIIKAALAYQQRYYPQASMRFDVIAIDGDAMDINWIISAFDGF